MAQQNQLQRVVFSSLPQDFNQHYLQLIDTVNSLQGYSGPIQLKNHIDMGGKQIKNLGQAVDPYDAITGSLAQSQFSAAALRPQLEANGTQPLRSVRRIADQNQREPYSSFLNDTFSAPPNANNTTVLFSSAGSGSTTITVPAGIFRYADGETISFSARTATVPNPEFISIQSISAANDIATCTTVTPFANGLSVGQTIGIAGVTPNDYNGSVVVYQVLSPTEFTYIIATNPAPGTGGTASTVGVYYYYLQKNSNILQVFGSAISTDSPYNRLPTSVDGQQIIAIALVGASGGQPTYSAGGGTARSIVNAGSFF